MKNFYYWYVKKNMKKSVAHKRSRRSSSSAFNMKRFVLVDAEARFYDSVKQRAGLKERGFEINPTYMGHYEAVINKRS